MIGEFGIYEAKDFVYTSQGQCLRVEHMDDAADFQATLVST